ncbi:MAG: tryptophan synthase subunit alpha [Syntrophomonadaceae bacterium]|nr:tryptophan synthase subunit alpha [Syntrophomonadaceae bacterium]
MRIKTAFQTLKDRQEAGLIAYLSAGDPDLKTTGLLVERLAENGVDLIELGVPFSDPVADGPVIQRASQRALQAGTNLLKILDLVAQLRAKGVSLPILLMSYYNPILRQGLVTATELLATAGVDGLIVPDLPLEESMELRERLRQKELSLIYLLAPTSSTVRVRKIAQQAQGFIYCVSLTGVTGERDQLPEELPHFLQRVSRETTLPLAVGFGLSRPEQMPLIASLADAAVVGSAFVSLIEQNPEDPITPVCNLAASLKEGLGRVRGEG